MRKDGLVNLPKVRFQSSSLRDQRFLEFPGTRFSYITTEHEVCLFIYFNRPRYRERQRTRSRVEKRVNMIGSDLNE